MSGLAALPYVTLPNIDLGPVSLHSFGILVAVGVLVSAWVGRLRGKQLGVDENEIRVLTGYLLVSGFVGAHLFDVFFYQWDKMIDDPILILKIWDGISSYGGFLGAAVGFALFCKVHKVDRPLVYADITITGTLPGFTFGRMGCASVHDHLGSILPQGETFPLAIETKGGNTWPDGSQVLQHDLGLYELVFLLILMTVLVGITRMGKKRPVGFIPGFVAVVYGLVRFYFDTFRPETTDPRHLGFTFAQWVSIITVVIGVVTLYRAYTAPKWDPSTGTAWNPREPVKPVGTKKPAAAGA
ncbi:MAG TPA: prolipoprotein diacylglyceryl transferase, partial [Kofleriaceae bacterium]|nr:prolipoprotein diacylglyceryl transferase [Kofleriaceae bacterium]